MIRLEREKMQNAISRAKVIHPKVRMIGERTYAVTGSSGKHLHGALCGSHRPARRCASVHS